MGEEVTLKREVGWFGSFSLGYADVGADIFIALGLVILYAAGIAPAVFLIAAIVYVCIGLAYAELAPIYPYAGGAHVYAMKAFNDLYGFIAGWALIMDYTIDISLFALAASGYLLYLTGLTGYSYSLSFLGIPLIGLISIFLIILLIIINYLGIRYSVEMSTALVIMGLAIQVFILVPGFILVFNPSKLIEQIRIIGSAKVFEEISYIPFLEINLQNFLYSITLAMASFVGIESIAQAAEETKRPLKYIPKAAKLSVIVVLISVMSFSILSIGSMDWTRLAESYEYSIAALVETYPVIGKFGAKLVALAGFVLCYASSNTGIVGVSRLVASMGKFKLLPVWFYKIHPRFRTPTRTVIIFGMIGLLLTSIGSIPFVAELYVFGSLLGYVILMLAFIKLRNTEEEVYKPWITPGEIKIPFRRSIIRIPLTGLIGLIGVLSLLVLVMFFHGRGRILGLIWITAGLLMYVYYRRKIRMKLTDTYSKKLIVPASYIYRVGVLIRPIFEETRKIVETITKQLDKRFEITLISIIEPSEFNLDLRSPSDRIELEKIKRDLLNELEDSAEELRNMGYKVSTKVLIGDLEKVVSREIESGRLDFIALIRRMTEKGRIEKAREDRLHKVISRYRGNIMVLRRV
ncbi:MAG: APC family permease [Nitrososphaerota archaeon]